MLQTRTFAWHSQAVKQKANSARDDRVTICLWKTTHTLYVMLWAHQERQQKEKEKQKKARKFDTKGKTKL